MMRASIRRLLIGAGVAVPAVIVVAVGCAVPAVDFSDKNKCNSNDDCPGGQSCVTSGTCEAPLCDAIPYYSENQVVNGLNDDFLHVPLQTYLGSTLVLVPAIVGDELDLSAQVAWNEAGLHMFFHVHYEDDGSVLLPSGADPIYIGDGMELFLKSDNHLTGAYGGTDDPGALQIIVTPNVGIPQSETYDNAGSTVLGPLSSGEVASNRDSDGYDLEFFIPWKVIGAPPGPLPSAGSNIGLDVAIDYQSRSPDAPTNNPGYQLLLNLAHQPDNQFCGSGMLHPSCDDRTWCTPTLLAP
jgi:hypothetical protein